MAIIKDHTLALEMAWRLSFDKCSGIMYTFAEMGANILAIARFEVFWGFFRGGLCAFPIVSLKGCIKCSVTTRLHDRVPNMETSLHSGPHRNLAQLSTPTSTTETTAK